MYPFQATTKVMSAILMALVISGCATSQKMSSEDKQKIKSTQISQSVDKGQVFLLTPGGSSAGLMFGAAGALATSGSQANEQTTFLDYLKRNDISIEKIVQQEFESALRASGKLAIVSAPDASVPTIKLSIPQYGFGVTHLLSSNVVPVLQIKGEMIDASSGKVVWSASDRMLPSIASPMDAMEWKQLAGDPKQVEEQLRKASKYLSNKLVQSL